MQIVNAAPMVIDRGAQDLSTRVLPREAEPTPQHLPKVYLYTQKGPTTPQLVSGVSRINMYGTDSFDLRKQYANHATVFSNAFDANANAQMIHRIVPDDIGPEGNLLLSLDVLATTVDLYEKNTDGSVKLDPATNLPIKTGDTATGYKVKWVVTSNTTALTAANFGQETIKPGDQTDTTTSTQSQRYPVIQLKASSLGAWSKNSGIRIWGVSEVNDAAFNTNVLSTNKAYPFRMAVINRATETSSAKVVETNFGEQSQTYVLKPNTIDSNTDKKMYLGDMFLDSYRNLTDLRFPKEFGQFGDMHVYDDNITFLLEKFVTAEIDQLDDFSDLAGDDDETYMFNMFSGTNSNGSPYNTFQFVTASNAVVLSEYSNIYADGGSDGTMDDASFAELVAIEVAEYTNPNSNLMDLAYHTESIIYDSGFPVETKKALCNFIGLRKDTFVVLGTHVAGNAALTASEENSLAISLRSRLQMFPESEYYGTSTMRGLIMGRSGKVLSSQYTGRLPCTYEVAVKSSKYMGAGEGSWKNGGNFDHAPGSIVTSMYDINVPFTSARVRNLDWDAGLNWVQTYDRTSLFIPALKTVYTDDTSVLNSYFTALAIGQLNKIAHAAWREFSGVSSLTNAQLANRVNEFVQGKVERRFDDRFVIKPGAYFTEADTLRGYSWSLPISIWASSLKTVQTTWVKAFRIEDLATTTA